MGLIEINKDVITCLLGDCCTGGDCIEAGIIVGMVFLIDIVLLLLFIGLIVIIRKRIRKYLKERQGVESGS